jgi:hypothetical protein
MAHVIIHVNRKAGHASLCLVAWGYDGHNYQRTLRHPSPRVHTLRCGQNSFLVRYSFVPEPTHTKKDRLFFIPRHQAFRL